MKLKSNVMEENPNNDDKNLDRVADITEYLVSAGFSSDMYDIITHKRYIEVTFKNEGAVEYVIKDYKKTFLVALGYSATEKNKYLTRLLSIIFTWK